MGWRSRSSCAQFEWSSFKAILVPDDMLLSSYATCGGVLVFLSAKLGFIKDAEEAAQFQNFIVCIEMLVVAMGHLYAFPYKEYAGASIGGSHGFTRSLAHALKLNDFYHDTIHQVSHFLVAISQRFHYWIIFILFMVSDSQFSPTYHDYVLYNHNVGDEGTGKYQSRTFVPTGLEMDTVRRNKLLFGNKLDDIQLFSLSPSGTSTPQNPSLILDSAHGDMIKSSLLVSPSNSYIVPYDMSLIDMDLSNYPSKVPAAKETEPR